MRAFISSKNISVADNVIIASSISSRVMGLMFKKEMNSAEGLLIEPCNSIHTCFMKISIDVLFINKKNEIVHIIKNMKPWRFSSIYLKSKKVLELNAGTIGDNVCVGDKLEFVDV